MQKKALEHWFCAKKRYLCLNMKNGQTNIKYLDKYTICIWIYKDASTSIIDKEKKIADVQEEIEQNLELVGATAIEDKLQDNVGYIYMILYQCFYIYIRLYHNKTFLKIG